MALSDSLNQAAWAFIQDWMNKRQQQYQLENMKAQMEGWSKYQEEGSVLEMQRMLDALQAQKEGSFNERLLALPEKDDPSFIRALEMLAAMAPAKGLIPQGLLDLIPKSRERSDVLAAGIGPLLEGETQIPGVDITSLIQSMGGFDRFLRAADIGKGRLSLTEQLPGQRANAAANLLGSGTSRKTGTIAGEGQVTPQLFTVIGQTKADIDTIHRKWLPAVSSGSQDQILAILQGILPEEMRGTATAKEDARDWINKVGFEFFDDLSGLVNEIYIRAAQGQITEQELRIIVDAASPYKLGLEFGEAKQGILEAYEKDEKYKGLDIADLYKTDPKFRRLVLNDTWNLMYGGQ